MDRGTSEPIVPREWMTGAHRAASTLVACVIALGFAAGCGSDPDPEVAPDPATLTAAFDAEAAAAYEEQDSDREENSAVGIVVEDCLVIDDEARAAIAGELLGDDAIELSDTNFLLGAPGEEERLTCRFGERHGATITAGTTTATAEGTRERLLGADASPIEGEAEGLDPDSVAAGLATGSARFAWIEDGFMIGVSGPEGEVSPEEGFAALTAAVTGVERTLAAE